VTAGADVLASLTDKNGDQHSQTIKCVGGVYSVTVASSGAWTVSVSENGTVWSPDVKVTVL
jgi:hypothetical protein